MRPCLLLPVCSTLFLAFAFTGLWNLCRTFLCCTSLISLPGLLFAGGPSTSAPSTSTSFVLSGRLSFRFTIMLTFLSLPFLLHVFVFLIQRLQQRIGVIFCALLFAPLSSLSSSFDFCCFLCFFLLSLSLCPQKLLVLEPRKKSEAVS